MRHGERKNRTKEYSIWSSMMTRCYNKKAINFEHYGGRGIVVCERWHAYLNFLADMGRCQKGLTLDRYPENDGNYEPGNCRWATRQQQQENKRPRKDSRIVTYQGKTQCIGAWARELGITYSTLEPRLRRGMSMEQAVQLKKNLNRPNVIAPEGMAWCGFCKTYKQRKEFFPSANNWHGLDSRCKKCHHDIHIARVMKENRNGQDYDRRN